MFNFFLNVNRFPAGRRRNKKRTSDRGIPTRVPQQHGQGSVDVEPDARELVVRVRVVAERLHLVAAEQPSDRGRHERAEVRQRPVQQPAGDASRFAILRRVQVFRQEHTRREQRAHHVAGGAQTVQSIAS